MDKLIAKMRKSDTERRVKAALKKGEDPREAASAVDACHVPAPARARYYLNDPSVEKLGEILADNIHGVMVDRDELSGWLNSLEKDNQRCARAFYLEAWDGSGDFSYDRIERGTIYIPSAIVSVFGTIRPGRLGPYVRGAVSGGGGDDGLVQRFQLLVWPDVTKAWRNVDRWPDSEANNKHSRSSSVLAGLSPRTWV